MLIPDEEAFSNAGRMIGDDELVADPNSPSAIETFKAAMQTENALGSAFVKDFGLPDGYVDNAEFNPFDLMTEAEKDDPIFSSHALLADSPQEINALRINQARESKNRQTLQDAGALGMVATFGAALTDPINMMPVGGVAYRTYKTGGSILAGAMATGSVAAGVTAVDEMALHSSQLQRTYGESAINMGAGFFLGGILGGASSQLSKVSDNAILKEIDDVMSVEEKIRIGEDSVGAMSAIEDAQIKGKVAKGLARILGWDPLSRTLISKNPFTRSLVNRMV